MTRHGKQRTNLGAVLRAYRILNERTLRDLAPEIGTSSATLMRIEQGYEVDQRTFMFVLNWLVSREVKR